MSNALKQNGEAVLVTGAMGYVGSVVVEKLLARGYKVYGLTRSAEVADQLKMLGVMPVIADLSDLAKVEDIAADLDGIVHTATLGGPVPGKTMGEAVVDAVVVTNSLADISARNSARLVVMSGTSIYGPTGGKTVDETAPAQVPPFLQPLADMEQALASDGHATFLRSGVVFGRDQSAPMKATIDGVRSRGKAAIVDPANRLSVVHVDDLAVSDVSAYGSN